MSIESNTPIPTLSIGEVAERLETTTRTLRFYEQEGLIEPLRSPGGRRLYSEEDMKRCRAILLLGRLGTPIQRIRKLAAARANSHSGNESSREVTAMLEVLRGEAREMVALYQQLLADIDEADGLVRRCFGCRKRPTRKICDACEVGARLPESLLLSLVWEQPRTSST